MSEALSMLALGLAAQGGGGGEPTEYLKSASVADNELTLTKKDGTTVVYEPTIPEPVEYTAGDGIAIYSNNEIFALVDGETILFNEDGELTAVSGGSEGAVRYDEAQTLTDAQKMQARANQGLPYSYSENTELKSYGGISFQLGKIDTSTSPSTGVTQEVWDAFFKPNTIFYISIGTSSSEPLETVRCKVRNINTFNCLTDTTNMSIFNYDTTSNYPISRTGITIAYKGQPSYITGYVGMTYDAIKIGNKLTKDYMDAPLLDVSNVGNDGSINTGISFYGATASKFYHGITMGNKADISVQGDYSLAAGYVNGSGHIDAYTNDIAFGRSNGQGTIDARGMGSICVGFADEAPNDGQSSMGTHGTASQAFGYQTKAGSNYQMAIGKNNIRDNNQTYAFIIGNGENISNRSNALTVDWDGNLVCNNIPAPPSADGNYALKCSIVDGTPSYSWVEE